MANYQTLIGSIQANINANGNNEITGNLLQSVLISLVTSLGSGYQFMGTATPATNPGTPDQKVIYIATQKGTYPNFGNANVTGVSVLKWDSSWHVESLNVPDSKNIIPNLADVVPEYFGGYIGSAGKFVADSNISQYKTIRRRVMPGKQYLLVTPSNIPSASYYVWTTDYDGQIPIGSRVNYRSGRVNILTAPADAAYLFVCIQFGGTGDYNLFSLVEEYGQFNNILQLWPNIADVTVKPLNGYIDSSNKFIDVTSNGVYSTARKAVAPGKSYIINVKTGAISSTPYYLWTADLDGQSPIGTRQTFSNGENVITAPTGAKYLFVCMRFNNSGDPNGYSIIEWDAYLQRQAERITTLNQAFQSILTEESKNIYNQSVVVGYINASTGNLDSATGYKATGLIPVLPNKYYYISNNQCSISTARCLGSDGTTKYKLLSAGTNQEYSSWRIPDMTAGSSVKNGPFKTPANAAFLQFTIDFNQSLSHPEQVMVEYMGDVFDSGFAPSPYQPYSSHTVVKMDAMPSEIAVLPNKLIDLENGIANAPKVLLIGSSHGMNTIGQFPMLAYHSGYTEIVCGNAYQGSLSLEQLAAYCTNGGYFGGSFKVFKNGVWTNYGYITIAQMLTLARWDVISIQRSASEDMSWTASQAGFFETILAFITATCNWTPKVVFNSGFADSYSISTRTQQQSDSTTIWSTAQQVKNDYGVEIIPMAPAMQLLRNNDTLAALGTYQYGMLSCDDQHLDQGIGMYAAGCVCFNFFLRYLNRNVLACQYLPTVADMTPFWYESGKFTAITETNAKLIRKIVCQYFAND